MTVLLLTVAVLVGGLVVAARAFGWQAGPLFFLVALTPYAGLGLALAAVLAGLLRAWWLALASAVLAAVVAAWWIPAFQPLASSQQPLGIRVMTVNTEFGRADPRAVVELVNDEGVDLLSVQELTPEAVRGLEDAGLREQLPHRIVRTDGASPASGTGMWSRHPLRAEAETDGLIFENLVATVRLSSGPVDFFAIHAVPPAPMDGNRGSAISASILSFLDSRRGPAIAAGDFNATRDNVPMRDLAADGWVDAAAATGAGLLRTWPNDLQPAPPLVALDHVLTRGTAPANRVVAVNIPATDHRAVIADL